MLTRRTELSTVRGLPHRSRSCPLIPAELSLSPCAQPLLRRCHKPSLLEDPARKPQCVHPPPASSSTRIAAPKPPESPALSRTPLLREPVTPRTVRRSAQAGAAHP